MRVRENRFQFILIVAFAVLSFLIVYPLLLTISVSLSDEKEVLLNGYKLIPQGINLSAYKYIFANPSSILKAYGVTFVFSAASMVFGVLLMAMLAYPLTKKELKGRNFINFMLFFTMLFNGGLVPTYILLTKYLHLNNNILVYILPSLISPWYTFMIRTFFSDLPDGICEAAMIDGAGEYRTFFTIVLPLSKPVIAAVALFTFLAKWNDWFTCMLYIDDKDLTALQYLLQKMMNDIRILQESGAAGVSVNLSEIPTETVRMAMAVIVAGPALCVFPFFQKYFVKGLTVGGVKG